MMMAGDSPTALVVVATALALLVWTLALERRRARPGPIPLARSIATVLWVVALALLILRPGRQRWIDPQHALVATEGANHALWTEATSRQPGAAAFRMDDETAASTGFIEEFPDLGRLESVTDVGALVRNHPEMGRLVIVGHGLPTWTWRPPDRLGAPGGQPTGPLVETFLAAPLAPGVQQIRWSRQVVLGQRVVVEGVLSATTPRPGVLQLIDDGGIAGQWNVPTTDADPMPVPMPVPMPMPFVLETVPRTVGKHRLRLRYRPDRSAASDALGEGSTVLFEEWLDVAVGVSRDFAVLWLASAPSFDARHLRQWLTAQTGSIVSRTGLTHERQQVTLAGNNAKTLAAPGLRRLTTKLLAGFDVLVLDVGSLAALRRAERAAVEQAVAVQGLGVLVRLEDADDADRIGRSRRLPSMVPTLERVPDLDALSSRLSWPGTAIPVPLTIAPYELVGGLGVEPLVRDQAGRLLAAARVTGRGAIGWSLVEGTYRWALAGHAGYHRAFWSHVLGRLGRPPGIPRWQSPTGPVLVDQPAVIYFTMPKDQAPLDVEEEPSGEQDGEVVALAAPVIVVRGPGPPVALEPRPVGETTWAVDWWPRSQGWHVLTLDQDAGAVSLELEVQAASSWRIWQQAERQRMTADSVAAVGADGIRDGVRRFTPWSRGWAFGLFLLALGYLWFDERWSRIRGR